MNKELIIFQKASYDNELAQAKNDLKAYNKFITDIAPFAETLGLTIDKAFLSALINKPKEMAFDTIVGNAPLTIAGVNVSKEKAMDLIEFPDAWLSIIKQANLFKAEINKQPVKNPWDNQPVSTGIGLESFELVNNELVLNDAFMEGLTNKHSVFTASENQNLALKHVLALNDAITELKKLGVSFSPSTTLESLGYSASGGGMYSAGTYQVHFTPLKVVAQVK